MAKIRPVRPGGMLGFVGPSGAAPEPLDVERAAQMARDWGYGVKIGPQRHGPVRLPVGRGPAAGGRPEPDVSG